MYSTWNGATLQETDYVGTSGGEPQSKRRSKDTSMVRKGRDVTKWRVAGWRPEGTRQVEPRGSA